MFTALLKLIWGFEFLTGGLWERLVSYRVLAFINDGLPEGRMLGVLLIVLGVAHVISLHYDRKRELLSDISTLMWGFVTICMTLPAGPSPATLSIALVTFFCMLSSLRQRLIKRLRWKKD